MIRYRNIPKFTDRFGQLSSHRLRSTVFMSKKICHKGFTAIEFLTSVGIIFVLITMLLPAILRTRDAARASQCLNNLKQLSLGMHNYHDANQTFPPGYISIMGIQGNELENEWGWGAFLLPYLDQSALFQQIDFSTSVSGLPTSSTDVPFAMTKASNSATAQTDLPPFRCPVDESEEKRTNSPAPAGSSSYSGVSGIHWMDLPCATVVPKLGKTSLELLAEPCKANDGAFYLNSHVRMKDMRDGSSQTMFLAETSNRMDYPIQALSVKRSSAPLVWGGTNWASVVNPLAQDHVLTATIEGLNQADSSGFSPGINSWHRGGAHAAFADGSIRFLSENIDSNSSAPNGVLQHLSTISASDVISEF
jgi:prepilin-type processing-associated H-X9-DG protein